MQDLSSLNMTELVNMHNGLADILGVSREDTFKSLAAARSAVSTLEARINAMNQTTTNVEPDPAAAATTSTPVAATTTPATRPLPTEAEITAAITKAIEAGQDPEAAVKALMEAPAPTVGNQKYNSAGKRGPNQGIGSFAKEQILNGHSNQEILEMIQAQFPTAKTTTSCIAFYRTALKKGTGGAAAATAKQASPTEMREQALKLMEDADALEQAQQMQAEEEAAAAKAKAEALEAAAAKAKEIVAKAQEARAAQQALIQQKIAEMQQQREAMLAKAKSIVAATNGAGTEAPAADSGTGTPPPADATMQTGEQPQV